MCTESVPTTFEGPIMDAEQPTVLIVEDEIELAELFGTWLAADYTYRIAHNGEEALDEVGADVDVILLDRRMPGMSGDEVLDEFREMGIDCPVGMVTAVEPDFDIVQMGFEDYIVKPVSRDELHAFVEDLLALSGYEDDLQRFFELASKRAALESSKNEAELQRSEEYQELIAELETVQLAADNNRDEVVNKKPFEHLF